MYDCTSCDINSRIVEFKMALYINRDVLVLSAKYSVLKSCDIYKLEIRYELNISPLEILAINFNILI